MNATSRLTRILIRAYPAAWRREYGDEFLHVLSARHLTAAIALDVIWNGLRQRLRSAAYPGAPMPAPRRPESFLQFVWPRLWWAGAIAIAAATTTFAVASYLPKLYRSETVIQVVPPHISEGIVNVPPPHADRLVAIQPLVLSPVRVERVIQDLNLYPHERGANTMPALVDRVRRRLGFTVGPSGVFRVSFIDEDPRTAMRVSDRVSTLFIDEALRDRELQMESTRTFLDSQLNEVATALIAKGQQLERAEAQQAPGMKVTAMQYEMLQSQYRALFAKRQESDLAANLERRQIGEQFKILESARIPTSAFSPDAPQWTVNGLLAGFGLGLVVVLLAYLRHLSRAGTTEPLEQPAS